MEGHDLLRVALLGGVIGFAVFCFSYAIFVWRRRNSAGRAPTSRIIKLAQVLAAAGVIGLVASWSLNEFQDRAGIAEGNGLFVVRARSSPVRSVFTGEAVTEGEVVADFLSPSDRAWIDAVATKKAQAAAKRKATEQGVLQLDEGLLQEQSHQRAETVQLKGFAFELKSLFTRSNAEGSSCARLGRGRKARSTKRSPPVSASWRRPSASSTTTGGCLRADGSFRCTTTFRCRRSISASPASW